MLLEKELYVRRLGLPGLRIEIEKFELVPLKLAGWVECHGHETFISRIDFSNREFVAAVYQYPGNGLWYATIWCDAGELVGILLHGRENATARKAALDLVQEFGTFLTMQTLRQKSMVLQ